MATVSLAAPCGDVGYFDVTKGNARTIADDWAGGRTIATPILKAYASGQRRCCDQLTVRSIVERMPDQPYNESTFCHDNCRGDSNRRMIRERYDPEEKALRHGARRTARWKSNALPLDRSLLYPIRPNCFQFMES